MVSNLIPLTGAKGLGGESALVDDHLLDSGGRVRDWGTVAEEIGDATAQFAYLDYELREHLRKPMARGYPPKLFISYRRETPEHVRWCASLSRKLEAAGYKVLLDALEFPEHDPSPEELARFVGRFATADVAVIVLTPEYVGTDDSMRRWIFEEWQRINSLRDIGLLEVVWIVRETGWYQAGQAHGQVGPIGVFDAVIDLSDHAEGDDAPVLEFFGRYEGVRLSDSEQDELAREASSCLLACRKGDDRTAAGNLDAIRRYRGTEEYGIANAAYHAAFRTPEEAIFLSEEVRKRNPTLSGSAALGTNLWLADLDHYSFGILAEITESRSLWRTQLRYQMSDILVRQKMIHSAINQLSWLVKELGSDKRQRADPGRDEWLLGEAREQRAKLTRMADTPAPLGPWTADGRLALDQQCEQCDARYGSSGAACAVCGTLHPPEAKTCWMCAGPVLLWENLPFCPVCRQGFAEDNGARAAYSVIQRDPGHRFSVLWPQANAGTWGPAPPE